MPGYETINLDKPFDARSHLVLRGPLMLPAHDLKQTADPHALQLDRIAIAIETLCTKKSTLPHLNSALFSFASPSSPKLPAFFARSPKSSFRAGLVAEGRALAAQLRLRFRRGRQGRLPGHDALDSEGLIFLDLVTCIDYR